MKIMKALFVGSLLTIMGAFSSIAQGQSVTFRVEELFVPPSIISGTPECIQVGIFMSYTGPTATWGHFEASLDYTYPVGFLSGVPFVNVTDFAVPGKVGLTNPGSVMTNSSAMTTPCPVGEITNSVTLSMGANIPLMTGAGGTAAIVTESVVDDAVSSGTIDITSLSFGSLFTTVGGQEYLMAIIEYPVAAPGVNGQIDITFRNGSPADNFITDGVTTLSPSFDDGFVQVFQTEDCNATNFAVFADQTGAGSANTQSATTLNIDYLDTAWGGVGGDVDATINFGANVSHYQLVGDDGSDTGMVPVVGPGSMVEALAPVNATTVYTLTYFTLDLMGSPAPGTPCSMTIGWNAASCTITVDDGVGGPPIPGNSGRIVLTLTNSAPSGGIFASIDVPNGATGLADPIDIMAGATVISTAGNTVTLEAATGTVAGDWAGTYDVSGVDPPGPSVLLGDGDKPGGGEGNRGGISCSTIVGFNCPSNNVSALVGQQTIGLPIDLTLSASDVLDYDITYNGVTTNVPGTDVSFTTPNNAVASATTITVAANGIGPNGLPCDDTVVLPLDFVAPTCDSATQSPDSTVTPVDVGTVITLTLVTSGAVSATIDAVPMSVVSGTVGFNNVITWQATHVATGDTTITAVVTNPDGETTSNGCSWPIDINCVDPMIVFLPPIGQTGLTISGTPDCVYTVRVTEHSTGSVVLFDITIGPGGTGVNTTFAIPPDSWIEVGQETIPTVTDSVRTVPTLGQWGLIAFVTILMAAGVFFMRRKRLV